MLSFKTYFQDFLNPIIDCGKWIWQPSTIWVKHRLLPNIGDRALPLKIRADAIILSPQEESLTLRLREANPEEKQSMFNQILRAQEKLQSLHQDRRIYQNFPYWKSVLPIKISYIHWCPHSLISWLQRRNYRAHTSNRKRKDPSWNFICPCKVTLMLNSVGYVFHPAFTSNNIL